MKYFVPVSMGRLTAAVASGSVIWAMRNNSSTARIRLRRFSLTIGFDGTASPASAKYGLYRFSGANFAGGNAITPVKADSSQPVSVVTDARQNPAAALTQVGVTIEDTPFLATQNQRDAAATTSEIHTWEKGDSPVLRPGEGICIKLDVVAVIGDYIAGTVGYDEVRHAIYT